MTPTDIVMDLGARDLRDAIDHTTYALSKQVPSAGQVCSDYGLVVLTVEEQARHRAYLEKLLGERLAILRTLEGPL